MNKKYILWGPLSGGPGPFFIYLFILRPKAQAEES